MELVPTGTPLPALALVVVGLSPLLAHTFPPGESETRRSCPDGAGRCGKRGDADPAAKVVGDVVAMAALREVEPWDVRERNGSPGRGWGKPHVKLAPFH